MVLPARARAPNARAMTCVPAASARSWALATLGAALAALGMTGCGSSSSSTTARTATIRATTTAIPRTPGRTPPTTGIPKTPTGVGIVTGSAGGVTATLRAGTHNPQVNRSWPIHFTVIKAGRPARASVGYEYLFAGQVVAHRSHYTFVGRFSDVFRWPPSAVGYPLTFRAVIVSEGVTVDLDYPIRVVA